MKRYGWPFFRDRGWVMAEIRHEQDGRWWRLKDWWRSIRGERLPRDEKPVDRPEVAVEIGSEMILQGEPFVVTRIAIDYDGHASFELEAERRIWEHFRKERGSLVYCKHTAAVVNYPCDVKCDTQCAPGA